MYLLLIPLLHFYFLIVCMEMFSVYCICFCFCLILSCYLRFCHRPVLCAALCMLFPVWDEQSLIGPSMKAEQASVALQAQHSWSTGLHRPTLPPQTVNKGRQSEGTTRADSKTHEKCREQFVNEPRPKLFKHAEEWQPQFPLVSPRVKNVHASVWNIKDSCDKHGFPCGALKRGRSLFLAWEGATARSTWFS